MNAFGMVIFSHVRSCISSPESGSSILCTTEAMSVVTVSEPVDLLLVPPANKDPLLPCSPVPSPADRDPAVLALPGPPVPVAAPLLPGPPPRYPRLSEPGCSPLSACSGNDLLVILDEDGREVKAVSGVGTNCGIPGGTWGPPIPEFPTMPRYAADRKGHVS